MKVIGLTGSIGMGKSTTLRLFEAEGCAVWDADAAVHRLYGPGGAAVEAVQALFPGVAMPDGGIDRPQLAQRLRAAPEGFSQLEAVVHPLVRADRAAWLAKAEAQGVAVAVVDVPLLFETGADAEVDVVVVVSAPAEIQKRRVLARPGMTQARFEQIMARQTPDADKRARADFVIETGATIEEAHEQVRAVLWRLSTSHQLSLGPNALHRPDERGE